jgi:hypothetical protein
MIRINCTNCKAQLSIDEAFAGGVCRCQYCGTIQTVPKHLKADAAATPVPTTKPAGNGDSSKVLHKKKSRTAGSDLGLSSGLDAIADAVASSGLSGSGLSSNYGLGRREPLVEPSASRPANNKLLPLLVISGVLIILLVGVVIGLLMKNTGGNGGGSTPDNRTGNESTGSNTAPRVVTPADTRVTGPAMLGLPLNESSIIFLLDRGSGMRNNIDYEKMAALNAIDSLRPEQKFQVIFWKVDNEKDPLAYPKTLVSASNKEEVKKCAAAVDEVGTYGTSNATLALEKAFASKPGAIVLVTGKQMDDTLLKMVMDARKTNTTRVHCLSLGEKGSAKVMQDIASKTGGIFRLVKPEELQAVSR